MGEEIGRPRPVPNFLLLDNSGVSSLAVCFLTDVRHLNEIIIIKSLVLSFESNTTESKFTHPDSDRYP